MIRRLRIEPYSDYLERYRKAESFPVSVANGFVFVSALPPFDPDTGEIARVAFDVQAERVMAQLKHCLEAAGSSMAHVLKCNVYCTPEPAHFAAFNAIYDRCFAGDNPARIFVQVPCWPGPFDVEIDCVAVVEG
jgi:2-iminobutanoate/2-iminopropanoate deaminase